MRGTLAGLYILFSYFISAQNLNWTEASIFIGDSSFKANIALDQRFLEGGLMVKEANRILSFSPRQVDKFITSSKAGDDTIEFRSVSTSFAGYSGIRPAFLMLNLEGKNYSLYSRFILKKKSTPFVLPTSPHSGLVGVYSYVKNNEVLFLEKEGIAYQISRNVELEPGVFKIDKKSFYYMLGDKLDAALSYCKKNKKKIYLKDDLIEVLSYVDSI